MCPPVRSCRPLPRMLWIAPVAPSLYQVRDEIDYYGKFCKCCVKMEGAKCNKLMMVLAAILALWMLWNTSKLPYTLIADSLTNATADYDQQCTYNATANPDVNATDWVRPTRCWGLVSCRVPSNRARCVQRCLRCPCCHNRPPFAIVDAAATAAISAVSTPSPRNPRRRLPR